MKPISPFLPAFWFIYLHLLLLFTFKLPWFRYCRADSALTNETDHLALLKFKESILNDPDNMLVSWNSSNHFCNWHGITCSRKHQRVTELNLQGHRLHGLISRHVGNLSFLRNLNLMNNSLYGKIPPELGRLFRLQQLLLGNNTLEGEFPTNLIGCSELRDLGLSWNNLSGKIPTEIGSLAKLEMLQMNKNNLIGKIPSSIGNLSSLVHLRVAYNNLEGSLPEEIGRLKTLETIWINSNKLSGTFPSSVYNMSSLTSISAASNQLKGSLPTNMFLTLPNLQVFGIGINQISGPIPASITNASMLQRLDISHNQLIGHVPIMGQLQDLWWLDVSDNSLGGNSSKDSAFLESLINCSKLYAVDISHNNFRGPLPNPSGNLSNIQLSIVAFGSNKLSGKIPANFGNLVNLIALGLDLNYFTETIPATFGKLQRLQLLSLAGNKLSGEIPASIGNLSQLSQLWLSHNMLEGNIPSSIGNCQNLKDMNLSRNNLSGAIPSQVIGLSYIQLDLSKNSLTGNLPAEVGKLKNIGYLDVSENHLIGNVSTTIGDCISLEYLYLQGNFFHGTIPMSLASLKGLRDLDLSRNNFSGSIPKALQDISVLEYLNVSFNMLDGEVPTKGVFKNASAIAVTGNSKLCGGISQLQLPPCLVKVRKGKKHHKLKLITVVCCMVTFFLILSSILAIYWMRKRNRKSCSDSPTIEQLSKVSYQSLHNATDGFSHSNFIGSGGFGSVYRGRLESEEKIVAVKVLNLEKKGSHRSFINECNILKNIRHRNLVKILTCCSSTNYRGHEFKALVFEYMKNGSLEKWLHPEIDKLEQSGALDLDHRLNIIIDIASALHYLHYECEQPIIHCDLKPSNVLLDDDMVAHVSDFGLATLLSTINGTSYNQTSTIGIKGTIGYTPPEYGMGSELSVQGDIYSFGVLMLEVLTGRRPTDGMFTNGQNLHNYVQNAFPDDLFQIVDPPLVTRDAEGVVEEEKSDTITFVHALLKKCFVSLFRIGLACSMESPRERMNIMDVTKELNHIRKDFLTSGIHKG